MKKHIITTLKACFPWFFNSKNINVNYGMYINVETCMFSLADIKLVLTHSSTGMSIQHKSKAYNW